MSRDDWDNAPLAELIDDAIGGLWGSAPETDKPGEEDVLVIRGADFRNWESRRAKDAARRRVPARALQRRRLAPGDLVLEVSGGSPAQPVGRVLVMDDTAIDQVDRPLITSNFCRKLRLKASANPYFVKRQLDWLYQLGHANRFQTSTTNIRNLQVDDFLAGTEIVLPPDHEQQILTALLDMLDTKRSSSLHHVAAAKRAIERFRQAVLAAAYRDACEDGTEHRLEELLDEPMRNGYSAKPTNVATPFRVLTLTATTRGWFDERHYKYTKEEFGDRSPFWVRPGDILVQRGNTAEYVGVPAIYEGSERAFLFPDLMIRVRVRPDISPRYVWYMLLSPQLRNVVRSQATGSAGNMPKVNQRILNDVLVPLPEPERRARIVRQLDQAFVIASRLAGRIEGASRRLDRSSQAILAKAFRGELEAPANAAGDEKAVSGEPI